MAIWILHYVHDPLCGWRYAACPIVETVANVGIPIVLHEGGLWETPADVAATKRAHIQRSDARIAELTGVTFGAAYLDGMLMDADAVFWSLGTEVLGRQPPCMTDTRCRLGSKADGQHLFI